MKNEPAYQAEKNYKALDKRTIQTRLEDFYFKPMKKHFTSSSP
jgi:hypothetical protein